MPRLLTAGHGTLGREGLTELFRNAGVEQVVDVRRFPGSRRNPDVSSDVMPGWLAEAGIEYWWEPRLGGRRQVPKNQAPEVDGWWRVEAFRAYAAYMRTDEFGAGLAQLLARAMRPTLIMCSESVWWRCHRRLISDDLVLQQDVPVHHLAHDGRLTPHSPSEGARVTPDGLRYDLNPSR